MDWMEEAAEVIASHWSMADIEELERAAKAGEIPVAGPKMRIAMRAKELKNEDAQKDASEEVEKDVQPYSISVPSEEFPEF